MSIEIRTGHLFYYKLTCSAEVSSHRFDELNGICDEDVHKDVSNYNILNKYFHDIYYQPVHFVTQPGVTKFHSDCKHILFSSPFSLESQKSDKSLSVGWVNKRWVISKHWNGTTAETLRAETSGSWKPDTLRKFPIAVISLTLLSWPLCCPKYICLLQ